MVLKAVRFVTEEWHTGALATAFEGHGMVRVYDFEPGAVLMEELSPGTPLVELVNAGRDDEAITALARVMREMLEISPGTNGYATVEDWGRGFGRYLASGDTQIPLQLVEHAGGRYSELCRTQSSVRLLHGDLQHYNVLSDRNRGWVAIDPKGVVGELEYDLGAALRNPYGHPDLYSSTSALIRRIDRFANELEIDRERAAAWAYTQAVLSAIWSVEDTGMLASDSPALELAAVMRAVVT